LKIILPAVLALLVAGPASGIVIRHDVADASYRVPDTFFPPLADIPVEGQGVLIAPQWVVTAAHATQWQRTPIRFVTIAGKARAVTKVVVHPAYRPAPPGQAGDAATLLAVRRDIDDIALLKLAEPVRDVRPAALYRGGAENGKVVTIIGKGATGNGATGCADDAPHRTALRRAENRIDRVVGHWLTYTFDKGAAALPLEGIFCGGDSGGPALIRERGAWKVAGLTSWGWIDGHIAAFGAARYGETAYLVRISHYVGWIDSTIEARGR
jgi:hypothetical protein